MMDGCLDKPKTSAPSRNTRVATYWFAPFIKLTTAITADTPMTTPINVSTLRSLCAHRLEVEIATASNKFMVLGDRIAAAVSCEPGWFRVRDIGSGMGLCGDKLPLILTYARQDIGITGSVVANLERSWFQPHPWWRMRSARDRERCRAISTNFVSSAICSSMGSRRLGSGRRLRFKS